MCRRWCRRCGIAGHFTPIDAFLLHFDQLEVALLGHMLATPVAAYCLRRVKIYRRGKPTRHARRIIKIGRAILQPCHFVVESRLRISRARVGLDQLCAVIHAAKPATESRCACRCSCRHPCLSWSASTDRAKCRSPGGVLCREQCWEGRGRNE